MRKICYTHYGNSVKLLKILFLFTIIFIIGSLGGVFGSQVFFPYLAGKHPFSEIQFIREAGRGTTIINRKEEVVVRENERLSEVVSKTLPLIVGVRSISQDTVYEGTGFILTADGLIATSNDLLLPKSLIEVVRGDTRFTGSIVKRDSVSGIAILKVEERSLPVAEFADSDIRLGELIFLLGVDIGEEGAVPYIETGAVRQKTDDSFGITINNLLFSSSGSPIFNIERKVVGLTLVRKGAVSVVPIQSVKDLLRMISE